MLSKLSNIDIDICNAMFLASDSPSGMFLKALGMNLLHMLKKHGDILFALLNKFSKSTGILSRCSGSARPDYVAITKNLTENKKSSPNYIFVPILTTVYKAAL